MITITPEQLEYIRARVQKTIEEFRDDRRFDNLLEHLEPNPAKVIENFQDAYDRYPDYGEMVQSKFRSVYYGLIAKEFKRVFEARSAVEEKDALYWQERYVAFLKTLSTEAK